MKKKITSLALAMVMGMGSGIAGAVPTQFFGEDLPSLENPVPLTQAAITSSLGAQAEFLGQLSNVGTQTFESLDPGLSAPLPLSFAGSSGNLTATLAGGNGKVASVASGSSVEGRYSVPSENSTKFWEVAATTQGDFSLTFGSAIGAFGFFGIDIGDVFGTLTLEFLTVGGKTISIAVPNSQGADGAVLFFGYLATSADELFTSVRFILGGDATAATDVFAFDNMTVADSCQIRNTFATDCSTGGGGGGGGGDVPEPTSLALAASALLALRFARRRKA